MEPNSKVKFQRARPIRLFEQAVEQIKTLIMNGHLKPGDRLPSENMLSQTLEVSRSSVREALRALESNGLIQVKSGAGAFVAEDALVLTSIYDAFQRLNNHRELVLQVLQVRCAIECLAASLAAECITDDELDQLNKNLMKQDSIPQIKGCEAGVDELAHLDAEFHLAVSRASRNEIVIGIISSLVPAFIEENKVILYIEKCISMRAEHHALSTALANHDPISADSIMRKHIGRVIVEVESFLSEKEAGELATEEGS